MKTPIDHRSLYQDTKEEELVMTRSQKSQFSDFELVTLWWKLLSNRPYWNQNVAVKDLHKQNKKWFDEKYEADALLASKAK